MNDDRIPAKFRYLAAIHHLIFTIVTLPIAVGIPLYNIFGNTPQIKNLLELAFQISIFLHFGMPMFSWLLWILTRKIHPFIDLAGRDIMSYSISYLLLFLLIIFITFTTCGIAAPNFFKDSSQATNILNGGVILLYCNGAVYFIHSIISAIFNIRGYRFKNRFLIPFSK